MQNSTDGDKIVLQQLDEYIKTTTTQDTTLDRTLSIEFSRLESDNSNRCEIIKDILRIPLEASRNVLLHPVIEAYTDLKWKKTRKYISAHFCVYLAFLLTYSWFLANIFYRPLHQYNEFPNIILSSYQQSSPPPPAPLLASNETNDSIVFPRNLDVQSVNYPQNIIFRLRPESFNQKVTTVSESNGYEFFNTK